MAHELEDMDLEAIEAFMARLQQLSSATGAQWLMNLDRRPSANPGQAQRNNPYGTSAPLDSGVQLGSVGGPGQNPLVPNYGPQGVIFGGGSPWPVDPGPANMQNAMVGLRDLMNTPLGQQVIAKLKEKVGAKGGL